MAYFRKQLERRTYSQDRYYILIKRQKAGKATFNELTELDEIVNRVPDIREKVIIENFMTDDEADLNRPPDQAGAMNHNSNLPPRNFWDRLQSLLHRVFNLQASEIKQEISF
jgi:hypothetical protein